MRHSLCSLEGIFTKMPFAPTIASSPYLPNPLLPTAVIARELKNLMVSRQVFLHPATTQFITILSAISLFPRDGRTRAVFYTYSLLRTFMRHLASPSWTLHIAPLKLQEIFRMPGMYKLYQLSTVFSSCFLARI